MNAKDTGSLQAWVFYLILALVVFFFQESIFRYVFPLPEISNFNRVNYSMLVQDQAGEKPQPLSNAAFTWASDPDGVEFVHHLNLYGFRDSDWPAGSGQRVMFVGDSFVEGFMAADDETIPHGFELASEQQGERIETINLGTGASGMDDYLAVIGDAVPIFLPQTVVLVLYANDFADNDTSGRRLDTVIEPIRTNPYLPRLYPVVSKIMKKESVATRWSKTPFQFLPTADSERSPLNDKDFNEYAKVFVSPEILQAMQQGRFNPFVVNEYTNYEEFLSRPTQMPGIIERIKSFVEAHASELLVVHIPYKGQVSDDYLKYLKQYDENKHPASLMADTYQVHAKSLRAECDRLGVPFLDMSETLRQLEADGDRMYWNYDEHMKGPSYLLTGAEIHRFWSSAFDHGMNGS